MLDLNIVLVLIVLVLLPFVFLPASRKKFAVLLTSTGATLALYGLHKLNQFGLAPDLQTTARIGATVFGALLTALSIGFLIRVINRVRHPSDRSALHAMMLDAMVGAPVFFALSLVIPNPAAVPVLTAGGLFSLVPIGVLLFQQRRRTLFGC